MKIIAYKVGTDVFLMSIASDARRQVIVTPARFEIQNGEIVAIEAETRDETDDELLAWVAQRDIPDGVDFKLADTMPSEDADLSAWFDELGPIVGTAVGREAFDNANEAMRQTQLAELQAQYDKLAMSLK